MHVAAKKPPTMHTYTTIFPYCVLTSVAVTFTFDTR